MRLVRAGKYSGTFETLHDDAGHGRAGRPGRKFTAAMLFYTVDCGCPCWGASGLSGRLTGEAAPSRRGGGPALCRDPAFGRRVRLFGLLRLGPEPSQVTAAMISLVFGASLFLLAYLADQLPTRTVGMSTCSRCSASSNTCAIFTRGVLDHPAIVCLSAWPRSSCSSTFASSKPEGGNRPDGDATLPLLPAFSVRQKWRIGAQVVLVILTVLCVVTMFNYLSRDLSLRFTSVRKPRRSWPAHSPFLDTLTNTVKVTLYYDRGDPFYSAVAELLNDTGLASRRSPCKPSIISAMPRCPKGQKPTTSSAR